MSEPMDMPLVAHSRGDDSDAEPPRGVIVEYKWGEDPNLNLLHHLASENAFGSENKDIMMGLVRAMEETGVSLRVVQQLVDIGLVLTDTDEFGETAIALNLSAVTVQLRLFLHQPALLVTSGVGGFSNAATKALYKGSRFGGGGGGGHEPLLCCPTLAMVPSASFCL